MDDAVHDRIGDWALVLRVGIESFIPLARVVLSAKDRRAVFRTELYELQQVVGFLRIQTTEQPLIQDEQVYFLVAFQRLSGDSIK